MATQHSGSKWIEAQFKCELSPLGAAVADLLGDCYAGIYHLDFKKLKKTDWSDPHVILVQLHYKALSTVDSMDLTTLVVLCHDRCLRLSISAATVQTLELMFHQRKRTGDLSQRHPSIEDHIAMVRRYHPTTPTE